MPLFLGKSQEKCSSATKRLWMSRFVTPEPLGNASTGNHGDADSRIQMTLSLGFEVFPKLLEINKQT